LGVPPADFEDDPYDEEDLFTKEEAIGMLAMALLYLTSWEEKGPNGQSTLRARKSIDPQVMEQLRDMGFISYDNNAQSVVMTKLGETMGKESVVTLGFDYLLDNLQLVD
jgi:ribosomal protein S19E (S16A)